MKLVYLIRHGQASFGQRNYDQLSDLGRLQSQWLGRALAAKKLNVDRYELGTLSRQLQTFECALGAANLFAHKNSQWNEFDHKDITQQYLSRQQLNRDEFLSLSDSDKMALFSKAMLQWVEHDTETEHASSYIETWSQFKDRAQQALQALISHTQQTAVVFTSGGIISTLVAQAMGLDSIQTLKLNKQLVNTGITKLLVTRNGVQVSTLNEYVHLEHQNNNKTITYR